MPAPGRLDLAILLAAGLTAGPTQAEPAAPPRWPTAAEIARARESRPLPPLADIDAPSPPLPRVAMPTSGPGGVDLEALAEQGSGVTADRGNLPTPSASNTLRIFVTLTMPAGSLERLVEQAERAGAVLVLRGLHKQSMRETLAAVNALIGTRRVQWLIDPEAFEHYAIQIAPTFVLTLAGDAAPMPGATLTNSKENCDTAICRNPEAFVRVAGDVSLDYALEVVAQRSPEAAEQAGRYLRRLRGS